MYTKKILFNSVTGTDGFFWLDCLVGNKPSSNTCELHQRDITKINVVPRIADIVLAVGVIIFVALVTVALL